METLLKAMRARHLMLDDVIDREQRRAAADQIKIRAMKRMRLRLKDEIVRLEASARAG